MNIKIVFFFSFLNSCTVNCIYQAFKEFLLFSVEVKVDQTPVHLQLCDTAGQVGIISPLFVPRDISSLPLEFLIYFSFKNSLISAITEIDINSFRKI